MNTGDKPSRDIDWPADLLQPVRALPEHNTLRVALSGGLDSSLLLHVVAACHVDVTAVHVNHQLQPNHEQTERLCRETCAHLSVPLVVERVNVSVGAAGTGGLEEAARHARYEVFHRLQAPGDLLLMAHHADDQAETVLFRLLRGSGVSGLAGMPEMRPLGSGSLFRPWLDISRHRLEQVGASMRVRWEEDPSNSSQAYDRNYLRHGVLPELKQRWPGLLRRITHSARACAESEYLNDRLAELHWQKCGDGERRLDLADFRVLDAREQRNLLRWWIQRQGWPLPSLSSWNQILSELLNAAKDRSPEIRGQGYSVRRYRGHLYLVPGIDVPQESQLLSPRNSVSWGPWRLSLAAVESSDTSESTAPTIRVSTRQGGERVRPDPCGPSRALKTWLQEQQVPPWERAALPLVYRLAPEGGELIAIGNLWCSDRYSGSAPAAGWRLIVERDCD